MNTNQGTTLTNQDALIEDEFKDMYPYEDMSNWDMNLFKSGYLSATKASEIEINSLKERVAELQSHLSGLSIEIANNDVTLESYAHKVAELQADNERLREALDDMVESYQYEASSENPPLLNARKILASTTAQSLAQHDNELLDKVIKILSDNGIYHDGIICQDILKLKVTP